MTAKFALSAPWIICARPPASIGCARSSSTCLGWGRVGDKMRFDILKTIYRKEMLDQLRDRRALLSMVIVPLVAIPALMVGMGFVISILEKKAEDQSKTLGIALKVESPEIRQAIEKAGLKIVDKV